MIWCRKQLSCRLHFCRLTSCTADIVGISSVFQPRTGLVSWHYDVCAIPRCPEVMEHNALLMLCSSKARAKETTQMAARDAKAVPRSREASNFFTEISLHCCFSVSLKGAYFYAGCLLVTSRCATRGHSKAFGGKWQGFRIIRTRFRERPAGSCWGEADHPSVTTTSTHHGRHHALTRSTSRSARLRSQCSLTTGVWKP